MTDKEIAAIVLAAVRLGDGATFRRKLPPMPNPGARRKTRTSRRRRARYFVRIGAGKFEMQQQSAWDALRRRVQQLNGIYRSTKHGQRRTDR